MKVRVIASILVVVFLVAMVGGCSGSTPEPAETEEEELLHIRINQTPFLGNAPLFIADAEGYYREQGLDVEFVYFDRSLDAIPALVQGDLDVWASTLSSALFTVAAEGANIRIVADKGYAGGCYVAMAGSPAFQDAGGLDNPEALRGQKIYYNLDNIGQWWVEKLLDELGLTVDDIEQVTMPPPAVIEPLASGELGLAVIADPLVTQITSTGQGYVARTLDQDFPDYQFAHIVFGPSIIDENPEVGRRFMVAYLKAVRQYNEGKTARNIEILAEGLGVDAEVLDEACWPDYYDDGHIAVDDVMAFQDWAADHGYVESPVTADQIIDTSFIDYALETLGE